MADHIEDIVLRYSSRGMTRLRAYMPKDYVKEAAFSILSLPRRTVFLTTGFYIPPRSSGAQKVSGTTGSPGTHNAFTAAESSGTGDVSGAVGSFGAQKPSGAAETDGPPGIYALAKALEKIHFDPVIITDRICRGLFEPEGLSVIYLTGKETRRDYQALLDGFRPAAFLSVERCCRNDQAAYTNMRGVSISDQTAPVDRLFDLARSEGILTVAVGDGGNEIGMGNVAGAIVREGILAHPCIVPADRLIIATTSNWGAFALAAWLSILSSRNVFLTYKEYAAFLDRIVRKGCVDGISKRPQLTVDGFSPAIEREIITDLGGAIDAMID